MADPVQVLMRRTPTPTSCSNQARKTALALTSEENGSALGGRFAAGPLPTEAIYMVANPLRQLFKHIAPNNNRGLGMVGDVVDSHFRLFGYQRGRLHVPPPRDHVIFRIALARQNAWASE